MSITGSLVGYENNNDIANGKKKRRSILLNSSNNSNHVSGSLMGKNCPPSLNSSIANSVVTNASSQLNHQHQHQHQHQYHHNHNSQHQHNQHSLQQHPHPHPHPPPPLTQQQQQHFPQTYMNSKRKHGNNYHNMLMHPGAHLDHSNYLHLNSLWSIWYGVLLTLFQGYLAVHGAYRFLGCSLIPWKIEPVAELNLQIVLSGVVFILLPLFFTSAVFKVGNLANDGIKLATGSKERRCSMSPHDGLEEEARGGTLRALWTHGGPTAAFVHIVIAMCLLLPRLLLEARIIENGLLPRENIWQTELDFIAVNRRSLVVLSVVTSPYQNVSSVDDEEDYYNDTMFTAISSDSSSNINNNLLGTNILSMPGRAGTAPAGGRTRFFEVPDLINRESNEDAADNTNDNDYNASVGGGAGGRDSVEHPAAGADDGDGDGGGEGGEVERISVEQLDSKEFVPTKLFNPQTATATTTTKATTTSTTTTSTTTTTTTALPTTTRTTTATANINNRAGVHKSYDKSWDKLGTLGKGNSLAGVEEDVVVPATMLTTTTGSTRTTTDKTTSAATTLAATTTKAAATSTRTSHKALPTKFTTKTATTTTKLTTTTAIASDMATSATPTIARTPPTRAHHKQQQQQHHAHSNGKSTRKHHHNNNNNSSNSNSSNGNGGGNRQHHRQRGHHQPHHRRHHNNNNNSNNANTSAGSRSEEARSSRADLRPSKAIDLNRLDELELTGGFEQGGKTAQAAASEADLLDYGRRALQPKSTSTISTTTHDSNIHIVKPEMLPEIVPSTPVTSNSKIIEIKTKGKRAKRMADDELQVEIEPEYLIGDLPANDSSEYPAPSSAAANSAEDTAASANSAAQPQSPPPSTGLVRLDGFAGMLQIFFGIERPIDAAIFDRPPSAEFINLVFALLVWCVRYPAVFWTTTKSFATVFSVQMIAAALDIVFSYIGAANLYKLQVYGEAMPIQNPGLILNGVVTLALFLLSSALMVASSMIMYLYGHGRLAAKMRDRSLITLKSNETWIYFAHCASLCYVLALAVVKAPLLSDLSATYKSNLHCPTFLSALISVVHLLLWIVIWLGLTAKRRWTFKLPPMDTYGLSKATTQPLLMANRGSLPSAGSGSGNGSGSGSALATEQKCGGGMISTASSVDGGADDVYWPKLTPSSPKLKVTFNEVTSTCDDVLLMGDQEQNDGKRHSPRGTAICFASAAGEIDDGEYATLRAATAASVVGISMGSMSGGIGGGTTPTGSAGLMSGVRVLHLSEYDELPPPPSQQLISIDVGGNPLTPSAAASHHSHLAMLADYANCGGGGGSLVGLVDDNTSEEGKLLACVRDDSVTYASTRDLEPPQPATATPPPPPPPPPAGMPEQMSPVKSVRVAGGVGGGRAPQAMPENMQLSSSPEHLVSPLAPVTVTVHTNEAHIASSSTPRCLRRADSGVPNEALTPRSDTTSTTESTTSPPERAPSESSSGVHSGEERDVEVVIRPRAACKPPPKPPQPPIQEEPYGRCTNMRMSSFAADPTRNGSNSATLPLTRSTPDQKFDYATHCSTMPLPLCHSQQQQQQQQHAMAAAGSRGSGNYAATSAHSMHPQQQLPSVSSFRSQYANSAVAMAGANAARMQQLQQQPSASMHTTLPNGVRYSNPHFLRRLPHVTKAAESPYGHLGLGAGHHTFSKLLQDPLQHSLANTAIPEDRDSANYSMTSDQDCNMYATAQQLN